MNYEERYKEALDKLKKGLAPVDGKEIKGVTKSFLEEVFPELHESEDEKIRKALIDYFDDANKVDENPLQSYGIHTDKAIAWLEKQGKQKPTPKYKIGDIIEYRGEKYTITNVTVTDNNFYYDVSLIEEPSDLEEVVTVIGMVAEEQMFKIWQNPTLSEKDEKIRKTLLDYIQGINSWQYFLGISKEQMISWLEKQGKQKSTDEIKPKFKVGDWITNGEYTWKVIDIKPLDYLLKAQNGDVVGDTISYVDEQFHLWTIQYAKEGDVLSQDSIPFIFKSWDNNCIAYCGITGFGLFKVVKDYFSWCNGINVTPATKEQRELLFQKMKEAGYVWYAEKKELKKIEKESTWSEEDEKCFIELDTIIYQNSSLEDYNRLYHWLKSLKPNHWKPSEEQMEAIKYFIGFHRSQANASTEGWKEFKHLESLINDLEKL